MTLTKPILSNDKFMAIICDLAHDIVEQAELDLEIELIHIEGDHSCYTEEGQEIFEIEYAHYETLMSCHFGRKDAPEKRIK